MMASFKGEHREEVVHPHPYPLSRVQDANSHSLL